MTISVRGPDYNDPEALIESFLEERPDGFHCQLCQRLLRERRSARRHMQDLHCTPRDMLYVCPGCDRTFPHRTGLKNHIYGTHPNLKGVDCEDCKVEAVTTIVSPTVDRSI